MLQIATCQFAVGSSIKRNAQRICEFLRKSRNAKADIVHFSECALSGYAGVDYKTLDGYDWAVLKKETEKIMALAGKLKLWVVLGSMHKMTAPSRPHNCSYLIGPDGRIVDRYDKRFCTSGDLEHFAPGDRFVHFTINDVKCSLLICFDLRFPEIYRRLWQDGVGCIFQSFYNARQNGPSVHTDIMRQTMQCRAATNYFYVSMANSSGYYSPYPSCFIQPDGRIARQLRFNRPGMMVNTVDINKSFYDPSEAFRETAINGALSNGPENLKDSRSKDIKHL